MIWVMGCVCVYVCVCVCVCTQMYTYSYCLLNNIFMVDYYTYGSVC